MNSAAKFASIVSLMTAAIAAQAAGPVTAFAPSLKAFREVFRNAPMARSDFEFLADIWDDASSGIKSMIYSHQKTHGNPDYWSINKYGKIASTYTPIHQIDRATLRTLNDNPNVNVLMEMEVKPRSNSTINVEADNWMRAEGFKGEDGRMPVSPKKDKAGAPSEDQLPAAHFSEFFLSRGHHYSEDLEFSVVKIDGLDTRVTLHSILSARKNDLNVRATGRLVRETSTSEFRTIQICLSKRGQRPGDAICSDFVLPAEMKNQQIIDFKFHDNPDLNTQELTVITSDGKAQRYSIEQREKTLTFHSVDEAVETVDRSIYAAKMRPLGRVAVESNGVKGIHVESPGLRVVK